MVSQTRGAVHAAPGITAARRALATPLTAVLLFVLALVPRAALWQYLTVDEADHWFDRADAFLLALRHGDWAGTNLIGHPGVTTMWLGAAGLVTHQTLARLGLVHLADPAAHRMLVRLPSAIVTSLCVALAFPLLRRLLNPRVALLAALFWAGEPFLVAHSQLLHTDALLTSFIMLALLAAMVAFRLDEGADRHTRPLRRDMLCVSAVATGLGVLTKSPSVILVPMLGVIAFGARLHASRLRDRLPLLPLVTWGLLAAAVWFILWPAAWVDPAGSLLSMYREARFDGGTPHGWGNFFLGHAVADPGPLFYPVATALRLAPWTLIGLVTAGALVRPRRLREQPALALLAIFILLFGAMMTVGAKKFDRYVLPIFPALDIVAAAGLCWLASAVYRRLPTAQARTAPRILSAGWLLVVAGLGANVLASYPYQLAYYNPLLGGGRVAAQLIPIGWGEGSDQVGAFLNAHSPHCDFPVAAWYKSVLAPYTCDPVVSIYDATTRGKARYAVLYIDQLQRNNTPDVTAALRATQTLVHTVRINGIDYAYVYELPPALAHPVAATFGTDLHFNGYDANQAAVHTTGMLTVRLDWTAPLAQAAGRNVFVHLLDAEGKHVGQLDLPLVGPQAPPANWHAEQPLWWDQAIPVPTNLKPGSYWLAIGVYSTPDGKRLPLAGPTSAAAPADGPDALRLGPLVIR